MYQKVMQELRHIKFKKALTGLSRKTLSIRLKELQDSGILESQAYNEIPPRVEYRLTIKGQELVECDLFVVMDEKMVKERLTRPS